MDSLLELMSSSGISSMSVSLCPFWLKCCGTASVVLFCMAVYDALQICHVVRVLFVRCILLEHLECFCIFGIGSFRWGFWMHKWLFAWYDVLGLCFWMYMMTDRLEWRSRFCISLSYISWFLAGLFVVSVYFYFCFYEEIAEVVWASVCDERFFRKKLLCNGLKTEVWESV